jgi:high-affinity iron transporter
VLVSNALIGLREGLEASLVVVILLAFLRRSGRTWAVRYVWLGVGAAVALSVAIGAVLTYGTRQLSSDARELIGGTASVVAVGFVTVMVFWMKRAARTMSEELQGQLDRALGVGALSVALVGFLGVGREGLETAIFFYASVESAGSGTAVPLVGFVLGIVAAVALGLLIYRGALRVNLAAFFRWTGAALVVVAAGILAYGIHDLQEGGLLPGEDALAFNVSAAVPPDSWYGTLLRGTVNFTPETTWLQAIAWMLYVSVVMTLFLRRPRRTEPDRVVAAAAAGSSA